MNRFKLRYVFNSHFVPNNVALLEDVTCTKFLCAICTLTPCVYRGTNSKCKLFTIYIVSIGLVRVEKWRSERIVGILLSTSYCVLIH